MAKVSVIIPVFNREDYLDKCVNSMISQTFTDLEIILVDDGSSDSSPEMCDSFARKDSRIKVIHKPNGGVSSARNAGLDIASGEYICFCDSDDFFREDMVEKSLKKIVEDCADMCTVKASLNYKDDSVIYDPVCITFGRFNCGRFFAEALAVGQAPYSASSSIYKASLIKENNIRFEDYKKVFSEDALFNLMVWSHCKKYTHLNESLCFHFRHENSLMTSSVPGDYITRHVALTQCYENFIKASGSKAYLGDATACLMWDFIRIACSRSKGDVDLVVKDFESIADNKFFNKKILAIALGTAGSKYCKYHNISGKNAIHIRYTALLLLQKKFEQAARQYFL